MNLQYCEGGELYRLVEREGRLEADRALQYLSHLALGILYVHRQGRGVYKMETHSVHPQTTREHGWFVGTLCVFREHLTL
jgi:serine/threonine protein kinase